MREIPLTKGQVARIRGEVVEMSPGAVMGPELIDHREPGEVHCHIVVNDTTDNAGSAVIDCTQLGSDTS